MTALNHLAASLRSLKAARTQLKSALTTRGLPDEYGHALWVQFTALESAIAALAWTLRDARLARLRKVA